MPRFVFFSTRCLLEMMYDVIGFLNLHIVFQTLRDAPPSHAPLGSPYAVPLEGVESFRCHHLDVPSALPSDIKYVLRGTLVRHHDFSAL